MVGIRAPFLQRSELGGQAVKTAKVDAPKDKTIGRRRRGQVRRRSDRRRADRLDRSTAGQAGRALILRRRAGLRWANCMRRFRPGFPHPCATRWPPASPMRNTNSRCACSKAGELPKDQTAAARWFERAASLGLAPAQYRLGSMYEKGIGVTRDPAAAKRWYLKAAEAGNARAAHNLAVMSADPDGGEPNYSEAVKWFRKAAEAGVRDSQYNLAILYARGLGVEKNLGQSWLWFSLAAQHGDADAAGKRDEIAGEMDPGLARRRDGGADEIQGRSARPGGKRRRRAAGRMGRRTGSSSFGQSPPPPTPLTRRRLFDRGVRRREDPLQLPAPSSSLCRKDTCCGTGVVIEAPEARLRKTTISCQAGWDLVLFFRTLASLADPHPDARPDFCVMDRGWRLVTGFGAHPLKRLSRRQSRGGEVQRGRKGGKARRSGRGQDFELRDLLIGPQVVEIAQNGLGPSAGLRSLGRVPIIAPGSWLAPRCRPTAHASLDRGPCPAQRRRRWRRRRRR